MIVQDSRWDRVDAVALRGDPPSERGQRGNTHLGPGRVHPVGTEVKVEGAGQELGVEPQRRQDEATSNALGRLELAEPVLAGPVLAGPVLVGPVRVGSRR